MITSNLQLKNTSFYTNSSFLSNNSEIQDNTFLRVKAGIEQRLLKSWFGGFLNIESNNGVIKQTQEAILTNHQFKEYEAILA